jgi:hypothetical protein
MINYLSPQTTTRNEFIIDRLNEVINIAIIKTQYWNGLD